jgi:hypothetical protein
MGASGTATIDFGAFPGCSDAHVDVTGQGAIVAGSLVEAWLRPADTADHLADEHWVETIRVVAGSIIAGTGFTIYAANTGQINEPLPEWQGTARTTGSVGTIRPDTVSGMGTRLYGLWSVAWVWN